MNNGDMPAAPNFIDLQSLRGSRYAEFADGPDSHVMFSCGLTKREALTLAAMQGDWASQDEEMGFFTIGCPDELLLDRGRLYVRAANATLKALEESK